MRQFVLILLFVFGCAGLSGLGLWQVSRAQEKRVRYAAFEARVAAAPLDIDALPANAPLAGQRWRRAQLSGHYLPRHVVLDNRIQGGRTGYEVLTAFETAGGRTVMVDRGWIPLGANRDTLPDVLAPADTLVLEGFLGGEPVVGIELSDDALGAELLAPDLYRVQQVSLAALEPLLQTTIWPAVLYLDAQSAGALDVAWPVPGDGSSKHMAYAVQWFAMAAVLAAIGMHNASRRRVNKDA